jgi:hypothetical protein
MSPEWILGLRQIEFLATSVLETRIGLRKTRIPQKLIGGALAIIRGVIPMKLYNQQKNTPIQILVALHMLAAEFWQE